MMVPLLPTTGLLLLLSFGHTQDLPSCSSPIYCQGDLLDLVQTSQINNDSKLFVDLKQKQDPEKTLANFDAFKKANPNPTKDQITKFVDDNFESGNEFDEWEPSDYTDTPKFLDRIQDEEIKTFAGNLVKIWPTLARKMKKDVKENPGRYSLIPVDNGFIIPGGRFKEFYYWDSYWIIRGLLLSDMTETVKGMLDNFISLVDRFGFIPNGARVYYLNRSQPPLLNIMVATYIEETNDLEWLEKNIPFLEKELQFWINNRTVKVHKNGNTYRLARYAADSGTPRPESYLEDVRTASALKTPEEQKELYSNLKSGAESGHDFSSRWIVDSVGGNDANLTHLKTKDIIPVDLNAFLCQAFQKLSSFYLKIGDHRKAVIWLERSKTWQKTIQAVHYDEDDGIWYDYDLKLNKSRKYFYPTNFAPLWTQSYNVFEADKLGYSAVKYLEAQGIREYKGGIPTSLIQSGEQWDFPNAWPPLQSLVVEGLHKTGNKEAQAVAKELGLNWIKANAKGFNDTGEMFEKYDAVNAGRYGGGGEYKVQSGFGWTNGAVMEFINLFYGGQRKQG